MLGGDDRRDSRRRHPHRPYRRMQWTLQAWLLLLLLEKPSYGYELMERLSGEGKIPGVDPGFLYRTLRQLERGGMVFSSWDMEGEGPARRLYQVTPQGNNYLRSWADDIRLLRNQLVGFLSDYETYLARTKGRDDQDSLV